MNEIKRGMFGISEKIVSFLPFHLEKIGGASLDLAKDADSKNGDYKRSAELYYSVFVNKNLTADIRLNGAIGFSQQLINLGRLGKAKEVLNSRLYEDLVKIESPTEKLYFSARRKEKLGWIADNEGNYRSAALNFTGVIDDLKKIQEISYRKDIREVYSTSVHFLGRAYFGLGEYGLALDYFREHLNIDDMNEDEYAYGHGWAARCLIKQGRLINASVELYKMKSLFKEYLDTHPERGVMAKYYLIEGELNLIEAKFSNAEKSFNDSLEISYAHKDGTKKSKSEAMFGLSVSLFGQKRYGEAFSWFINAIRTYPSSLVKPSL